MIIPVIMFYSEEQEKFYPTIEEAITEETKGKTQEEQQLLSEFDELRKKYNSIVSTYQEEYGSQLIQITERLRTLRTESNEVSV